MEEDFKLLVNDKEFLVQTPELEEKLTKVIIKCVFKFLENPHWLSW
jgi:hypothetical protein